jgi:hypothetical protein
MSQPISVTAEVLRHGLIAAMTSASVDALAHGAGAYVVPFPR